MACTTSAQRDLVLKQASVIMRACDESVREKSDREDVRRRYDTVLAVVSAGPSRLEG
jgi:uncharacterized membrane protein